MEWNSRPAGGVSFKTRRLAGYRRVWYEGLVSNPFIDDAVAGVVVSDLRDFAFVVEYRDGFELSAAFGVGFFAREDAFSVVSRRDGEDLFVARCVDDDLSALCAVDFGFDDETVVVEADAIDAAVEIGVDFFESERFFGVVVHDSVDAPVEVEIELFSDQDVFGRRVLLKPLFDGVELPHIDFAVAVHVEDLSFDVGIVEAQVFFDFGEVNLFGVFLRSRTTDEAKRR